MSDKQLSDKYAVPYDCDVFCPVSAIDRAGTHIDDNPFSLSHHSPPHHPHHYPHHYPYYYPQHEYYYMDLYPHYSYYPYHDIIYPRHPYHYFTQQYQYSDSYYVITNQLDYVVTITYTEFNSETNLYLGPRMSTVIVPTPGTTINFSGGGISGTNSIRLDLSGRYTCSSIYREVDDGIECDSGTGRTINISGQNIIIK